MTYYNIAVTILIVLSPLGVLSNFLTIFICLRKELRKTPTFVFMAFIGCINNLELLTIIVVSFLKDSLLITSFLKLSVFLILWKHQTGIYVEVKKCFVINTLKSFITQTITKIDSFID
jgi:hypothetical protein